MPKYDLSVDDTRYLSLLLKNRNNDMVSSIEIGGEKEGKHKKEFLVVESLLSKLDPEDVAVYTKDYQFLR